MAKEPQPPHKKNEPERRKSPRIAKNFILSYFDKAHPDEKFELTQLKNIGKGGMCFITSREFTQGTKMGIELTTPYLAETTYLEGTVQESHEKIRGMIYETRIMFESLNSGAEYLLAELVEFFDDGKEKGL
jgi:hypothetical protein